MSMNTPHRTANTPTSRMTFTPCTKMNRLTLNSRTGINRTRVMHCEQQASDFGKRMFEIADEEDDTPEHPNLTMVLGPQKISFDHLMDDEHSKPSYMMLSDEDDSDEDLQETSNTFSPCRMSLSPDRGFPQQMIDMEEEHNKDHYTVTNNNNNSSSSSSSLILHSKRQSRGGDPHYDPDFSLTDGIYEEDDKTTLPPPPVFDLNLALQHNDIENKAPSLWLKHFEPSIVNLKKSPVINTNSSYNSNNNSNINLPLQEITIKHNILPSLFEEQDDRPTQKMKVIGDRPQKMRMMRSLSPTREDLRKGKEPSTSNKNHIDASVAFFL